MTEVMDTLAVIQTDEKSITDETLAKANNENIGRRNRKNKQGKNKPGNRGDYVLKNRETSNEIFFNYYKDQKVIPEEEWEAFKAALAIPLPSSFRIQRSLFERDILLNLMNENFFNKISEIAKTNPEVDVPQPLPFIPYAFQTNMPRAAVRSHPVLRNFHEFLVNETAIGNISRQEAVSMVPPLLLDIQSHHVILDACASPGSKTMQIIELMHEKNSHPDGLLVANDIEYDRCYLLVHQTLKRLPTANCVVVNHDSSQLPAILNKDGKPILYDRILCDLICSSDGTFRKNLELWANWDIQKSLHLHKLQQNIARRCIQLLEVNGLMVYSTCSLNPIEDEAVVAHMLRVFKGSLELVDVSDKLPELKRTPGVLTWKVFNKKMEEMLNIKSVPENQSRIFVSSMFPPTEEECQWMHLKRTFRILPHTQNSGGFFLAVLRKTAPTSNEKVCELITKNVPSKKRQSRNGAFREDPFVFFDAEQSRNISQELSEHYGIDPEKFSINNLLVRTIKTEKNNAIYYVNDRLKDFIINNGKRFKIVNAGVQLVRRVDKISRCRFRLCQDGLRILSPFITKRKVTIPSEDVIKILLGSDGDQYLGWDKLKCKNLFDHLDSGSVVVKFSHGLLTKEFCAWMGIKTISAFINREDKIHFLELLGADCDKLKRNAKSSRQLKADGGRPNIKKPKFNECQTIINNESNKFINNNNNNINEKV